MMVPLKSRIPLRFPWGELPQYPHVEVTPKIHRQRICWYTSGFR